MKKILLFAIFALLCSSSCLAAGSFAQDNAVQKPATLPSTEFVAYRKSDGELPIIIGDAQGHTVLQYAYPVPIHFGYPVRSYRIVGMVITHGVLQADDQSPRPIVLRSIAAAAKMHGAEAVIMLRLTDDDRRKASPGGAPWIVAKAIAVRWRRPDEQLTADRANK